MEYIEGHDLKNIIGARSNAPLPVDTSIKYAIQMALGLQEAHKKGIIHRDIKSGNIMISEAGKVKIMDFGLAKVNSSMQITQTGTTIGTAAYMSPEQAKGEKVDQRSDIWSWGIVLYEMLTGTLPFKGDYDQAIIYSIINDDPGNMKDFNPVIPKVYHKIVEKALSKDTGQRYQDIDTLLVDLLNTTRVANGQTHIKAPSGIFKNRRGIQILAVVFLIVGWILFHR